MALNTETQTPDETLAAIRAVLAWHEATPDAVVMTMGDDGDALLEYAYSAIDDVLAYNVAVAVAVEDIETDDREKEEQGEELGDDCDRLDRAFWDRVEAALPVEYLQGEDPHNDKGE